MKKENKIPLDEIHKMLNARAGYSVPSAHFDDLLCCWRRFYKKTRAGKKGWLSRRNALSFLHYAY